MENEKFIILKNSVQEIIDLIGNKQIKEANNKLAEVSDSLDELLDFSDEEEDLKKISHYQVVLNKLHQKIKSLTNPDS